MLYFLTSRQYLEELKRAVGTEGATTLISENAAATVTESILKKSSQPLNQMASQRKKSIEAGIALKAERARDTVKTLLADGEVNISDDAAKNLPLFARCNLPQRQMDFFKEVRNFGRFEDRCILRVYLVVKPFGS